MKSNSKKSTKTQPIALITGASSGIGLELAKLFAADGYRLVLVARDKARLGRVVAAFDHKGIPTRALIVDLATDNGPAQVYAQLKRMRIVPDVLVNNAGFGDFGEFADTDQIRNLAMIKTNVMAPTALTRLIVPDMIKRRSGRILNTASEAAFFAGPLMSVYYATKAYILSWSQALSYELSEYGITVTTLCPPPTDTGFAKAARLGRSVLYRGHNMNAIAVAKAAYHGLMHGKLLVIPGAHTKFEVFASRLVPRKLALRFIARHQRRLY